MDYAYSLHIQTDETVPVDLSLPSESIQTDVILYPNPTNGNELFLNGLPDNNSAEVSFVNLAGQTILRTATSATENRSIDISALDAGFYIVQIKVNNELIIRNFIKL